MQTQKILAKYEQTLAAVQAGMYDVVGWNSVTFLKVSIFASEVRVLSYFMIMREVTFTIDTIPPKKLEVLLHSLYAEASFTKKCVKDYYCGDADETLLTTWEEYMLVQFNKILKPVGKEFNI